jgi:hypothetical protein
VARPLLMRMYVLEMLVSDSAILIFAAVGLVATTASILVDARHERERAAAAREHVTVEA